LVRRTGFGATGPAVDAALKLGAAEYVRVALATQSAQDAGGRATPRPQLPLIAKAGKSAAAADKKKANTTRREQMVALGSWWLRRMVAVHQPFEEKLTFCWHNHFATSATKVKSGALMGAQNDTLRRLGRGGFTAFAQAMLVDPAMLLWLDGQKNTVKGANENLAREFMELFALGHGDGYTEDDVRNGARALTGWRIDAAGHAEFRPQLHDQTTKTVLGVTANLDQVGFANAVLARPVSAQFVATRLYHQFVSNGDPDGATVARLISAYGSGRDLHALMQTMLTDPSFAGAADSYVIGPVEWLVGVLRALGMPVPDDATAKRLLAGLRRLGQLPFFPPDVSGWPSGQAWMSTAAAETRMQVASKLTATADLSGIAEVAVGERIDAVGYRLGVGRWSARSLAALKPVAAKPGTLLAVAVNTPEYLVH
jgi:uncharacterized protein (DUF1800 family)